MKKIIWLFGENESKTMNNNSFYFWKNVCNINDEIDKYFVVIKNENNKKLIKSMSKNEKSKIVYKNSFKHWLLYHKSTMQLVSLSYKDVIPDKLLFKNIKMGVKKPIIYLQHGTTAIKKLGYCGSGYNNNFFRFFIYNKNIRKSMIEYNDFKDYQLYYAKYHPRYMELLKRSKDTTNKKQILYFLTWREYLEDKKSSKALIKSIKKLINDERLKKYLKDNDIKFKICLHQFFKSNKLIDFINDIDNDLFEIVTPSKVDVMNELANSTLLITDYSSVGFDFTFLNKPVILFTPDLKEYLSGRDLYCSIDELKKYSIENVEELVHTIINGSYKINEFFRSRLPKKIDYDYVLKGNHIMDMYNYLKEKELNKIAFIGYKFGGSGGTVSATKSLVEGLLEKGYLVELVSIKGTPRGRTKFPYGVRDVRISQINARMIIRVYEKVLRMLNFITIDMGSLKYDNCRKLLAVDIGTRINRYLKNTTSKTIVSTRESIHPFIYNCTNSYVKNKVYFFHTDANALNDMFPNLSPSLKKITYDNAVFVSKSNYDKYKKIYNLNLKNHIIIGNCITDDKIISRNLIKTPTRRKKYKGIVLTRLSNDRIEDINNMISFGNKLKAENIKKITFDIFGTGDAVTYLKDQIKKNKLSRYISYKGLTKDTLTELQNHDFLLDFSVNQSFGMIYLEGILAGKKIYASSNDGANEVLKGLDNTIYHDFDELINMLKEFDKVTKKDLIKAYDMIMEKYSKEVVTNKFISIIK